MIRLMDMSLFQSLMMQSSRSKQINYVATSFFFFRNTKEINNTILMMVLENKRCVDPQYKMENGKCMAAWCFVTSSIKTEVCWKYVTYVTSWIISHRAIRARFNSILNGKTVSVESQYLSTKNDVSVEMYVFFQYWVATTIWKTACCFFHDEKLDLFCFSFEKSS